MVTYVWSGGSVKSELSYRQTFRLPLKLYYLLAFVACSSVVTKNCS